MRYKVNSTELNKAILEHNLPQWKACILLGMSSKTLTKLLAGDKKIQTRTAAKLRSAFGEKVVNVTEGE